MLSILEKYPLLTSRKICQLEHLKDCMENNDWEYHLKKREIRYLNQEKYIKNFKESFVIPSYFGPWLSGFTEAKGCFRAKSYYICQNNDWYILNAIKIYLNSHHKLRINKDSRIRESHSNKAIHIFVPVQYRVSMSGKPAINNIINHFNKYPLLGEKKVNFRIWKESLKI